MKLSKTRQINVIYVCAREVQEESGSQGLTADVCRFGNLLSNFEFYEEDEEKNKFIEAPLARWEPLQPLPQGAGLLLMYSICGGGRRPGRKKEKKYREDDDDEE